MSRNNTHYWDLCLPFRKDNSMGMGVMGPDGFCDYHRRWHGSLGGGPRHRCITPRTFETRRGLYERKPRYPQFGGYYTSPPPSSMKKIWNRKLRAIAKHELIRFGEVQTDLDKLLAGWYQYWD